MKNYGAYLTIVFDLSQEIRMESRRVTSIPQLFGDLGGLNDFLKAIIGLLLARWQMQNFSQDRVKSMFVTTTSAAGS